MHEIYHAREVLPLRTSELLLWLYVDQNGMVYIDHMMIFITIQPEIFYAAAEVDYDFPMYHDFHNDGINFSEEAV